MSQSDSLEKTLTISIPTWNRCFLLNELIQQLVRQISENRLENKIEVLVSNNGSNDDTENLVKSYQKNYSFVSYNNNGINIGARANVLRSMELASGKFLMVLGDDDRVNKNCLTGLVNFLEINNETGVVIDSSKFKKNPAGNNVVINLTTLLVNFYWHMGNAGVFIVRTSFIKNNLERHPFEYFSLSWPQTQLLILGLYQNKNLKCHIGNFDIVYEAIHGQVMIYTSYYLWRTLYFDLFTAIESIKPEIDERTVNASKKYLSDNIVQTFYNILQCGIFLDDEETKQKTASHISENLYLFSIEEKFYLRIINAALRIPSPIAKLISNTFIFLIRGKKGIDKKNEFVKNEMQKKSKVKNSDNLVVREFQF